MPVSEPPKKLSPSALLNLKRWMPLSEFEARQYEDGAVSDIMWGSVQGGARLLQTIANKDIQEFGASLSQYPELLWEDFTCRDAKGRLLRSGRLADVIIDIGWTPALDALWQAGDHFDGVLVQDKRDIKYGPFENAMFNGQSAAYNRMIKLGVSINGKGDNPPLLVMAHRRHFDRDKLKLLGEVFSKTNVDLRKKSASSTNQSIFGALIEKGKYDLILPILRSDKREMGDVEAANMMREWVASVANNSDKEGMVNILLEMRRLNFPPPSLDALIERGAKFTGPCLGSDAFDGIMDVICRERYYVIENTNTVFDTLSGYEYTPMIPWKSNLQANSLLDQVQKAPSPSRPVRRF